MNAPDTPPISKPLATKLPRYKRLVPKEKDPRLLSMGKVIRQRRLALGLSQEKLAEAADLDRTYISGIERGEQNASLITIVRIASALGTTPSDLLRDVP